jgi:hypothetical protein
MIVNPETSRVAKVLVEAGLGSFPEVQKRLARISLAVNLGEAEATTPAGQAAALTAVITAARCFLGGVALTGAIDQPLAIPFPGKAKTVGEAAKKLGAKSVPNPARTVLIGNRPHQGSGLAVRAWWDGWIVGVRPVDDLRSAGRVGTSLSGVAAGALAVTHAFLSAQGDLSAGRIAQTFSLWSPGNNGDAGPTRVYLPKALWFVGLGNLGQAYLWSLSMLPFMEPGKVDLVFQDFDVVKDVNWGTSILVPKRRYGMLKTRLAEDWAMARGFQVKRIDRPFDEHIHRRDTEPAVALAGLDSAGVRKLLGGAGFDFVVDCGLGMTAQDYRKIRLNVFDRQYGPAAHFSTVKDDVTRRHEDNIRLAAYQDEIARDPKAACGLAEIAGASAAVPFVSAFAGALAIAQTIRLASDQSPLRSMVGSVENLRGMRVVVGPDIHPGQVGYSEAMDC